MYKLPTAPRSIGGVLDDAIGLYRATFKQCWFLALISGAVSSALSIYQTAGLRTATTTTTAQGWAAIIQNMQASQRASHSNLAPLVSVFVWLVIRAAIVARQHAAATGQQDSIGSALEVGLRRMPANLPGSERHLAHSARRVR